MTTPTQLSIYNGALLNLGERRLVALTDENESRRACDDAWNRDLMRRALSAAQWNFATRSVKLEYNPSLDPAFGYLYTFDKPTDWIRTLAFCSDDHYDFPMERYDDEGDNWHADIQEVFVKYCSDHASFGGNLAGWPVEFTTYIEWRLASEIALRLTRSIDAEGRAIAMTERALLAAQNTNAMNKPSRRPPMGSWASSRIRHTYRDTNGYRVE